VFFTTVTTEGCPNFEHMFAVTAAEPL